MSKQITAYVTLHMIYGTKVIARSQHDSTWKQKKLAITRLLSTLEHS